VDETETVITNKKGKEEQQYNSNTYSQLTRSVSTVLSSYRRNPGVKRTHVLGSALFIVVSNSTTARRWLTVSSMSSSAKLK
jgi:hypothetical protein